MNYPNWIEKEKNPLRRAAFKRMWRKPWTVPAKSSKRPKFKLALWNHGQLSPNFSKGEAASKDGRTIPTNLRRNAQYHAFRLEVVRHKVGDKSMSPLSWYRSPQHNASVGGVSNSQHLQAWATDWSDQTRMRIGSTTFNNAMQKVFANGGRGTYLGSIRHVDNGPARTWVY